ncbi:hypothetical protein GE061_010711 [Apolygus lucorum]|uniref:Uncharacterized protein n=1 Tax=Apolygus lucorum TaxID=248454 RepID=A0A6A4JRN1_APOLU|nr:hypothetical protein GE061_010711 [Apolygus lucorum]
MALPQSQLPSTRITDLEPGSTEWLHIASAGVLTLVRLVESCKRMPVQRQILLRCLGEFGQSLDISDSGVDVGSGAGSVSVEMESLRCRMIMVEQQLNALNHMNDSFRSEAHQSAPRDSSTPLPDISGEEESALAPLPAPAAPPGASPIVAPLYSPVMPSVPPPVTSILCSVCKRKEHPPTTYRCLSCKTMWNRLVRKCRLLQPTDPAYPKPCLRPDHAVEHPPDCIACKRWRYEQAWIAAKHPSSVPIVPVTPAGKRIAKMNLSLRRSEECEGAPRVENPAKRLKRRGRKWVPSLSTLFLHNNSKL